MKITVANFKGGVGKTTTAVHLAGYLSSKGSTLLVDGDQNQSSLEWSGRGFFNFPVIEPGDLPSEGGKYEHIVIDTEARPGEDDLETLIDYSDMLIIPTTPDALSIKASQKLLSVVDRRKVDLRFLITMVPPPPSHDGEDAYEFLTSEGLKVFKQQIKRFQAYKKAALAGCFVHQVKNTYAKIAWNDYIEVGKEILK